MGLERISWTSAGAFSKLPTEREGSTARHSSADPGHDSGRMTALRGPRLGASGRSVAGPAPEPTPIVLSGTPNRRPSDCPAPTREPQPSRHYQHLNPAGRILLPEHALRRLLELFRFGVGNIRERLGIAVGEREPRALHLDHDPVSAPERVVQVGHREVDVRDLARLEGRRFLPAVPEFGAEWFAA